FVVDNTAVVDLAGGDTTTLRDGPFTGTGTGTGTVQFNGGVLDIGTGVTFNFPGTLFQWKQGTIKSTANGGGTLNINSVLNIGNRTAGFDIRLDPTAALVNTGTINYTGQSNLVLLGGDQVTNQQNATFNVVGNLDIQNVTGGGTTVVFNNAGSFVKSGDS